MAGGMIPLGLKRAAALIPTCFSQAWLKEISLDVSAYVALVRSSWVLDRLENIT
jgi:hypothetical protein